MKLTVNYIKNCKPVDSRLLEKIDEILDEISTLDNETNPEEYFGFELNGIKYDVFQIDQTRWSDEGKYQYRQDLYQLVSYDDSIRPYVCDKSIVNCFNCFFEVAVTRSGSYFSGVFTLYTTSETIYRSLNKPEHIALLKDAFAAIGLLENDYAVQYKGKRSDDIADGVEKIKQTFDGVKVEVK